MASFFPAGRDRGITVAVEGFFAFVVRRRYSLIVGVEFGLLGAGAAVLAATGQYRWIAVRICFGVATCLIGGRAPADANEPAAGSVRSRRSRNERY